ncbi:UNVERIFIED_CONTAM: hypothetical protein FKN15_008144 [Acipenser sinensis]
MELSLSDWKGGKWKASSTDWLTWNAEIVFCKKAGLAQPLKVAGDKFLVGLCLCWRLGTNEPVVIIEHSDAFDIWLDCFHAFREGMARHGTRKLFPERVSIDRETAGAGAGWSQDDWIAKRKSGCTGEVVSRSKMDCLISPCVGQGTCKTAVACLISDRSSADKESLTARDVLSDATSSDGKASSCSPPSLEVAMDSMSSGCQSALIAPWGPKGTGGADDAECSRSNSASTVPWWETAAQSISISSESADLLEWQHFIFLREGEGEADEDEEDCEDSFLHELLSLTEGDGEERCAGVRDAERSVELRERRFSSVCLEKCPQNAS